MIPAVSSRREADRTSCQRMSAVWRGSQRLGDPLKDVLTRPGVSPELLTPTRRSSGTAKQPTPSA
jgi:hypothetical protein